MAIRAEHTSGGKSSSAAPAVAQAHRPAAAQEIPSTHGQASPCAQGVRAPQRLSHGRVCAQASRRSGNFLPGKGTQQLCFMENITRAAVSTEGPGQDVQHDQAFCKRFCEKKQPQEVLESVFFRSSPPLNHVWSLHSSPRRQTPASKSLLSSEISSIVLHLLSYLSKFLRVCK